MSRRPGHDRCAVRLCTKGERGQVLVKWLAGGFGPARTERVSESRALEVLKERYARGEIGKEEFEQKKRDLKD